MTAITDTRKRSRDEDTCDFMPISKRINNLTLTSQCLGEQDLSQQSMPQNGASNQFMAINIQEIQAQHFAQHSLHPSYSNGMSQQYLNQAAHSAQYHHQSHIAQSTSHSNGFHNVSQASLGTKQHMQQPHGEPNNNQMDNTYSPELTADENPFYYDKNKLLFDLHVERQRRHHTH